MIHFRLLTSSLLAFSLCVFSNAQNITGTTEVDVDPDTGTGTATCQTSLDPDLMAYYQASVICAVYDSDNNQIAYGDDVEYADAQIILTFQSIAGKTYTAVGNHMAKTLLYADLGEPQPIPDGSSLYFGWLDHHDISSFQSISDQIYPGHKIWGVC